jgi:hypothetical protein
MSNLINMGIGVAILCCSSCCSSSLMNSGLGGLFSGQGGGLLGGLLGLPGSAATGLLGLDKDAGGFEGGFTKGVTDPIGAVDDLSNLAQGKRTRGNTITEVDPESDTGKFFSGFKEVRCNDCSVKGWPADCTSKGFTVENCGTL